MGRKSQPAHLSAAPAVGMSTTVVGVSAVVSTVAAVLALTWSLSMPPGVTLTEVARAATEEGFLCSPTEGPLAPLVPLPPNLHAIAHEVCDYLRPLHPPTSRVSVGRWTAEVESILGPTVATVKLMLASDGLETERALMPWIVFHKWVDQVALHTGAFELRALSAPIMERLHWTYVEKIEAQNTTGQPVVFSRVGDLRKAKPRQLPHQAAQTVRAYNQAGQRAEAERFFNRLLQYEDNTGGHPYADYYDSGDFRRATPFPWPGLRVLMWPDPHQVLPAGVGNALTAAFPNIVAEATAVVQGGAMSARHARDAYPSIAVNGEWSKLVLYTAGNGWDESLCLQLPSVCKALRGKLTSEQKPQLSWYRENRFAASDEAVILFQIQPGAMAHLHNGQDARINVHMCLLNCDSTQLVVAEDLHNYTAGELVAFEDRADHEIKNHNPTRARVSLTVAVLHPDVKLTGSDPARPSSLLRYAIDRNKQRYWSF